MNHLTATYKRARSEGGRKQARQVHNCILCDEPCRGNGGLASHERACFKRHGLERISDRDLSVMRADDRKAHMDRVFKIRGERVFGVV